MAIYGKAPKPPDYTPLANAQVQTSKEMMDYMNRTAEEARVQNEKMYALTAQSTNAQLDIARQQTEMSRAALESAQRAEADARSNNDKMFGLTERATNAQIAQAEQQTAASKAALESALRVEADARAQNEKMYGLTKQVTDVQVRSATEQADYARSERERYQRDYVPLENQFRTEATGYDTEARRQSEAGSAIADVATAADASREAAARKLAGYGVDPSMLRAGALDLESRVQEAGIKASAGTGATRRVEDMGRSLRAAAIDMGRGLPISAANSSAGSTAAGSAAAGAGQGAVSAGAGSYNGALGFGANAISGGSSAIGGYGAAAAAGQGAIGAGASGYNPSLAYGVSAINARNGASGGYGAAAGAGQGAVSTGMNSYNTPLAYGQGASSALTGASGALTAGYNAALGAYEANQNYGPAGMLKSVLGVAAGAAARKFFADGGPVLPEHSPSRGAIPDDVRANVSAGEYVVPSEVVRWKGQEFFEKLKMQVAKAQQPAGAMST